MPGEYSRLCLEALTTGCADIDDTRSEIVGKLDDLFTNYRNSLLILGHLSENLNELLNTAKGRSNKAGDFAEKLGLFGGQFD